MTPISRLFLLPTLFLCISSAIYASTFTPQPVFGSPVSSATIKRAQSKPISSTALIKSVRELEDHSHSRQDSIVRQRIGFWESKKSQVDLTPFQNSNSGRKLPVPSSSATLPQHQNVIVTKQVINLKPPVVVLSPPIVTETTTIIPSTNTAKIATTTQDKSEQVKTIRMKATHKPLSKPLPQPPPLNQGNTQLPVKPVTLTTAPSVMPVEPVKLHDVTPISSKREEIEHGPGIGDVATTTPMKSFFDRFRPSRNRSPSPTKLSPKNSPSSSPTAKRKLSSEEKKARGKSNIDGIALVKQSLSPEGQDIVSKVALLVAHAKQAATSARAKRTFAVDLNELQGVQDCLFPKNTAKDPYTFCLLTPKFMHLHNNPYHRELLTPQEIQKVMRFIEMYYNTQASISPDILEDVVRKNGKSKFRDINLYPLSFLISIGNRCNMHNSAEDGEGYCLVLSYNT